MENPESLSDQTLIDAKELLNDFPWFHAARMLYLKNLAQIEDVRLKLELKKMAIFIPDRIELYLLLERYVRSSKPDAEKPEETFDLINQFLTESGTDQLIPLDGTLDFIQPQAIDYVHQLMNTPPTDEVPAIPLKHQSLIDAFIENDEQSFPAYKVATETSGSEALAHIYMQQQRYDKAIEVLEKASLENPEKNHYFAQLIAYLSDVINKTQIN